MQEQMTNLDESLVVIDAYARLLNKHVLLNR